MVGHRAVSTLLGLLGAVGVMAALVSGGSPTDPRTPPALPGLPPPFLGTAVVGDGGLTAAVDAYGDVVDLRSPGPAGQALIANPAARQAAGTVAPDTGIVPRLSLGGGPALPLWRAAAVTQRYRANSNVIETRARFGSARMSVTAGVDEGRLALLVRARAGQGRQPRPSLTVEAEGTACRSSSRGSSLALICMPSAVPLSRRFLAAPPLGVVVGSRRGADPFAAAAAALLARTAAGDRAWLRRARPLAGAPAWGRALYRRSLLVLRALADRRSGAVAAGARDGWTYVWPRDAAAVALALAASGYREEARRTVRFLRSLDLEAAARFDGDGMPVPGRAAQGDARGWVEAASRATAIAPAGSGARTDRRAARAAGGWRDRADYQEGADGDYLANAIAASASLSSFESRRGLTRTASRSSGLDSAAAWAVRPFARPPAAAAARRTLLRLAAQSGPFGIVPGEGWGGGADPWTAPTAWSAWSLAALGSRPAALRLLASLRRSATPAGLLPERLDAATGVPRSTTPLAWSHAFAILALRQLWPPHR